MNIYDFECVFNCGWGLLIVASNDEAHNVCNIIKDAQVIGEIIDI